MDETDTRNLPIVSSTGKRMFQVEVRALGGREQVSVLPKISDEELSSAIGAVGTTIGAALKKISPAKAIAEFSIELVLESGQLTALVCKGSATANLKVTLEWGGTD
jgi:hypothetical protein